VALLLDYSREFAARSLALGAIGYMMAKQQYLSDDDMSWHPHVMFFVSSNAGKRWGANLPGSPVIEGGTIRKNG
jgi:hypothetical protein